MKKAIMIIGAGCSFGKAIISRLAASGKVFILTEHKDRFHNLMNTVSLIHAEYPGTEIYSYRVDVTHISEMDELINDIEQHELVISSAVYCAGANSIESVFKVTEEMWDQIINVNLKGFFFAARAIAAHMIRLDSKGCVTAIASQHAVVANYDRAPYCASKAGLVHLIREMALEFAEEGIRFNAVSPSFIVNERNAAKLYSYNLREEYLNNIPLGRYAEEGDVGAAVSFLLSSDASFITGHNLILDGGYTIR